MSVRGPYETTPPTERPRTLGERIKAVRMAWHWTQAELGAALNTDQTAVSAWERERAAPSGPTLAALAGLLRISTGALETGKGFHIPEAPPQPGVAPILRTVTLPSPGSAAAQFVDLKKDRTQALQDPQEAMLKLIQATREGRAVWVVVE
jgi:transcriptional regulator with XRE-family HTH domain